MIYIGISVEKTVLNNINIQKIKKKKKKFQGEKTALHNMIYLTPM